MVFYKPGVTDHGLPFNPFKACVVPRPIGWISTLNKDGSANIAPYSQFNTLSTDPPLVMFSANQKPENGERKDTVINAEREGEFCWSLTTYELREAMNISAMGVPYGNDEFELAGLTKQVGSVIKTPMVQQSPVKVVIGRVVGIHIDESALTNGMIDVAKTQPIARCGYFQYVKLTETFDMLVPGDERTPMALTTKLREKVEADSKVEGKAEDTLAAVATRA
ncbi:flavin reductase family protein [Rhodotorula paludigena]|uniref:flavin reductase family protein n=1 Tax=Rhodotorula paludigena TaxID=86838 RepID=UPI0031786B45